MALNMKLFMKIFTAELDDLSDDLLSMENNYKEKFKRQDIGNFVYMENEAFLAHERECVSLIRGKITSLDLTKTDSAESLIETIRRTVGETVKMHEYPESVSVLINRKIDKVLYYLESVRT